MSSNPIPIVILGGTGYVAGELVRLILTHPSFELAAVVSGSSAGESIASAFPHLSSFLKGQTFADESAALSRCESLGEFGLFSALPHGEAAPVLKKWIDTFGDRVRIVDLSADFRFSDAAQYENIYGKAHPHPELLSEFVCGIPELTKSWSARHAVQPGCFTTAATLACAPLVANGIADRFVVNGVTGSTGSGRTPKPGTHHPERHSGMWAYELLKHRHTPEMKMFLGRLSELGEPNLVFLPHSGPFARGIHATVYAEANVEVTAKGLQEAFAEFYKDCPLIEVKVGPPSVKHVTGSCAAHLATTCIDRQIAVVCVIDNLLKGAAGGGMQWMNRLFGFEDTTGLMVPAGGWM